MMRAFCNDSIAKSWKLKSWVLTGLFIMTNASFCTKKHQDMNPEEVVQAYLDVAFNMEEVTQKALLMQFATDNLKAVLAAASDETIKAAYIDHRYDLKRFNIARKIERTPNEVELLIELSYKELPEGSQKMEDAVTIDTQNRIVCLKEQGRWLIKEVIGSSTSMDFPLAPWGMIRP